MPKERVFITVLGMDRVGIVAAVSGLLAKRRVNIADISQKIIEGVFTMVMVAELEECTIPLEELKAELEAVCDDLGLTVTFHHEAVFRAMHRI